MSFDRASFVGAFARFIGALFMFLTFIVAPPIIFDFLEYASWGSHAMIGILVGSGVIGTLCFAITHFKDFKMIDREPDISPAERVHRPQGKANKRP